MINRATVRSALPGVVSAAILASSPLLITFSAKSMAAQQQTAYNTMHPYRGAVLTNRGGSLDPATIVTSSPASAVSVSDRLGWPTDIRSMTSAYGPRTDPITFKPAFHTGSDFAAACESPIYAAADGLVISQGDAGDYGYRIVIDHEQREGKSLLTTYSHLSSIKVSSGQSVKKGDIIAYMGTTGYSTGCHLHFEVILAGWFTNPWTWLTGETTNDPQVQVGVGMPTVATTGYSTNPVSLSPSSHVRTTSAAPIPAVTSIPILSGANTSSTSTPENILAPSNFPTSSNLLSSVKQAPEEATPSQSPCLFTPTPSVTETPFKTPSPTSTICPK